MRGRSFREAIRGNLGTATVLTSIAFLGFLPLDVLTLFTPAPVDQLVDDVLGVAFLCSPLFFLIALAIPTLRCPRHPVPRLAPTELVPRGSSSSRRPAPRSRCSHPSSSRTPSSAGRR